MSRDQCESCGAYLPTEEGINDYEQALRRILKNSDDLYARALARSVLSPADDMMGQNRRENPDPYVCCDHLAGHDGPCEPSVTRQDPEACELLRRIGRKYEQAMRERGDHDLLEAIGRYLGLEPKATPSLDDRCGFCGCECAFRRCPCAKSGVFCTACGCDS